MVAPVAIFFFRQYVSGISKEFMEAARIDGCTEYGIFYKIMSPVMKPAYGAMTILLAMQQWNAFMWPLLVLRSNENFTLTIGIASMISPYTANYDVMFTGSILAILPILILFLFNQRFFISGLTSGGLKG
jgi:arabinosaccharide transport system permease protein